MATNGENQRIPPERKPVSEFPTPSHAVAFYTELVVRTDPAYKANAPVKRGSRYSTMIGAKRDVMEMYPDLFFLQETKYQNDDQRVLWYWATDENAHDTYNADVTYVANAVTYPAFTRVYTTRRELYEAEPTLPIGSPLPGIIAVEITSPGQNHTSARGVIDGTSVAIDFVVDSGGSLVSAVITNTGETLIQNGTEITIIGDGQDSSAIAITQPVGCVLTAQKKEELPEDDPTQHEMVRVTRVYETLPGPWIYSTRIDLDGVLVTTKTRRQVADFIDDEDEILGGEWIQTWHKETDDFVAEETVESRPIPGEDIVSTQVDVDGIVKTTTKTLVDATTVVSGETLVGGVWTKTRKEEVNSTTFVKNDSPGSVLVCWKVVETRAIPGNPMVDIKIDKDGVSLDVVKTMKDTSLINDSEIISGGGVWIKTEKEAISDLVAWEVVTARQLPGNPILSYQIDQDHETVFRQTILKDRTTIVPGASEAGGNITTVEGEEVSDLVANEVTSVKQFLDAASYSVSIENLIPREFRAFIPTYVESHILSGTASMPTLALGEFEHSQKQLTKLLYEDRITSLGPISLPIVHINQEITEEYGGGVLDVVLTLALAGTITIDEGYLVTRSTLTVLGNGMVVKETAFLVSDIVWPELVGTETDPRTGITIGVTKQVVPAGTTGGVVGSEYIDIKSIDKWRSIQIVSELDPTSLPGSVQWETTVEHSFPNTLQSVTWLWAAATDTCCYDFDMALVTDILAGYAGPCRARITESFSNGAPADVVTITQFFPVAHEIGYAWAVTNSGEDCNLCRAFAKTWGISPTLHDEITIGGGVILDNGNFTSTLPATVPTGLPASGTLITKSVDVERWRFGVFFRRITEIYVP